MVNPASQFTFGTVTDSYFGAIGDVDNDSLNVPDLVPVAGTVTFTPTLADGVALLFQAVPAAVTPLAVTATYDDQGRLSLNGQPFVKLVSTDNPLETYTNWKWTASFAVTANNVAVKRAPFSFALPGNSTVDLATVTPVTFSAGIPTIVGPKGDPGPGVKFRGFKIGTDASVLPSGYGAAQDGWTWRVFNSGHTYDELWAWVWTGSAGSWVDGGPFISAAYIDDTTASLTTVYSSSKVQDLLAATLAAANAYTDQQIAAGPAEDFIREQDVVTLAWPLRNAPSTVHVRWVGLDFPPTSTGYAIPGQDYFEAVAPLP